MPMVPAGDASHPLTGMYPSARATLTSLYLAVAERTAWSSGGRGPLPATAIAAPMVTRMAAMAKIGIRRRMGGDSLQWMDESCASTIARADAGARLADALFADVRAAYRWPVH